MSLQNPEQVILDTIRFIDSVKGSEITLKANGGNSILIVCEPRQEHQFINYIRTYMTEDNYRIINLNDLLFRFVEENKDTMPELFELLQSSVEQIFKLPEQETGSDLFRIILQEIEYSYKSSKIPVLIHSGALYGSGIENIHIMENDLVMKSSSPTRYGQAEKKNKKLRKKPYFCGNEKKYDKQGKTIH